MLCRAIEVITTVSADSVRTAALRISTPTFDIVEMIPYILVSKCIILIIISNIVDVSVRGIKF